MARILLATIFGAIALFIWGMASWLVLPWHSITIQPLENEAAVVDTLAGNINETGVYMFPGMPHDMSDQTQLDAFEKAHREGPTGMLFFTAEGSEVMPPITHIRGFGLNLLAMLFASCMLSLAADRLGGYPGRVVFVVGLGIFAALVSHVTMWNYFQYEMAYSAVMSADLTIGWLLSGMVLAAIIKPGMGEQ